MLEEIKESLKKVETANWKSRNVEDEYCFLSIMGEDCVSFAENAPKYIEYLINEVEANNETIEQLVISRDSGWSNVERLQKELETAKLYGELQLNLRKGANKDARYIKPLFQASRNVK